MKRLRVFLLLIAILMVSLDNKIIADIDETKKFVVHEWGVFHFKLGDVELSKSDILNELPKFIQKPRPIQPKLKLPIKPVPVRPNPVPPRPGPYARKPIIYFYTDKPLKVTVEVKLTSGKPLCWWPYAEVKNNTFTWKNITVGGSPEFSISNKIDKKSWFNAARNTDASWVDVNGTREKFLFYEGEKVKTELPLKITGTKDRVKIENLAQKALQDIFVFKDKKFKYFSELKKAETVEFSKIEKSPKASANLEKILVKAGLKMKEAKSIVKIWDQEFFKNKGIRIIYRMSRNQYDNLLSIKITPEPDKLVRVGLVLVEDINPELQTKIENLIKMLASKKDAERDKTSQSLLKIGRPALAALYRTAKSKAPEVKQRALNIINKIQSVRK